jgi:hypothetical protein
VPACRGKDRGAILTTIFGTFESIEIKAVPTTPTPKKKRGWLPLLTILFMISYGLMTMLIVEQGQTIESQRALIRELFRDSTELSGVKMKAQEERRIQALAQNPASQNPSSQNPSSQSRSNQTPLAQAPSTQARTQQVPSSQAEVQHRAQNQATPKPQFQMPSKPASDLVDHRRALVTI